MTKTFDTIGGSSQFMIGLAVGVWLVLILVIIFSAKASRPHYSEVEELREDNKVLRMQRAVLLELGNRAVKQTEEALALCAPEEK